MYASKLIDVGRKCVPEIVFDVYLPLRTSKVAPEEPTDRQAIRTRVYIPVYRISPRIIVSSGLRITLFIYIYVYIFWGGDKKCLGGINL